MEDYWQATPTLRGQFVSLRPTTMADVAGLAKACDDPETLRYFPYGIESEPPSPETVRHALDSGRQTLTQFDPSTGSIYGMTSIYNMSELHGRVTIGYTWLSTSARGRAVNSESKLLLLQHVFEVLRARRAEFNVDDKNLPSQSAVLAIGATHEGELRSHARRRDGTWRTTMVYSVISEEWPQVRGLLLRRVKRRAAIRP
jgi:RimJ/RimL family protein N-acetyltransferase